MVVINNQQQSRKGARGKDGEREEPQGRGRQGEGARRGWKRRAKAEGARGRVEEIRGERVGREKAERGARGGLGIFWAGAPNRGSPRFREVRGSRPPARNPGSSAPQGTSAIPGASAPCLALYVCIYQNP